MTERKNRKNIVLLTVECLRKDECQNKDNTPNLHRIEDRCIKYENFYQTSSWTPASIYSLFVSRYPLMYYPLISGGRISPARHDTTFIDIMQKNGYDTFGITTGGWLTRYFGFDKGFSKFYDGIEYGSSYMSHMNTWIRKKIIDIDMMAYLYFLKNYYWPGVRKSDRLNSMALMWLNDRPNSNPFFLWIHYPETHEPYYPSRQMTTYRYKDIRDLNNKAMKNINTRRKGELKLSLDERTMLLELYRSELKFIDKKIGDLLDKMKDNGHLKDTYVIIMGDHGQQFLEHGDFGHGVYLYQELCNVPLYIYNENFSVKKEDRLISGIDIAPSILHLANINSPNNFLGESIFGNSCNINSCDINNNNKDIVLQDGRDIVEDFIINGRNVYINPKKYKIALIKGRYKIIINSNDYDELYDLQNDPKEENNLADLKTDIVNELRLQLNTHMKKIRSKDLKDISREKIKTKIRASKKLGFL